MDQHHKKIIKKISDFVENEANTLEKKEMFENHILNIVKNAITLSNYYNANEFVVIIACYLHDITKLQTGIDKDHNITGYEFAKDFLKKYDISKEDYDLICSCILKHSAASKISSKNNIEEKILSNADAMDHIIRFEYNYYRLLKNNKLSSEEIIKKLKNKVENNKAKIDLDYAKQIIEPYYKKINDFIMSLKD
jgi:HD superfamily phosphodiesterase